VVEANEPNTIDYQFYLNKAETKCMVHETYANSKAVLAHNNGIASQTILPKALTNFNPQIYNLFTEFSR